MLTEQVAEGVALVQDGRFCYVNPAFCQLFHVPSAEGMRDGQVQRPPMGDGEGIARLYGCRVDGTIAAKVEARLLW